MSLKFLYVSPGEMQSLYATVSGPVINATYQLAWLVNGLPNLPLRAGTPTPAWDLSAASAVAVNFAAAINTNLPEGATVTFSGDIATVVTQPAYAGRIPLNGWALVAGDEDLTTMDATDVTATVAGTSDDVIIGELVVGRARELPRPIEPGGERSYTRMNPVADAQQHGQYQVFRRDKAARTFNGTSTTTLAGMDALQAWYDATNDGERMSVVVPDPLKNDAWAVYFDGEFGYRKIGPDLFEISLRLIEIPRRRWTW